MNEKERELLAIALFIAVVAVCMCIYLEHRVSQLEVEQRFRFELPPPPPSRPRLAETWQEAARGARGAVQDPGRCRVHVEPVADHSAVQRLVSAFLRRGL